MWEVDNRTPFAADRSWIRDRDGAEIWLVAVKCTFLINKNGTTTIAEDQEPVTLVPAYFGDPATSSLRYDTDFVLTKSTTDIILHGSAYAPYTKPVKTIDVTMRVGDVSKTLRITGDRYYQSGLLGRISPGPVQMFTRRSLSYEHSYGGGEHGYLNAKGPRFDERNPLGVGYTSVVGSPLPNVGYPGERKHKLPAGFGPIPPHWKPRSLYAGTYDGAWLKKRHPLYPLDLDDRFFLCSPEDQQPAKFLHGEEVVELVNLSPNGKMVFSLPQVALGFETIFRTGEHEYHQGLLHTVILEPDVPRLIMVWRTSLPCHSKVQSLVRTIVWQK